MKCTSPYNVGLAHPVNCRKCLACLMNRRRGWMHRLLLEGTQHADSCFVTLTYADESLPEGGSVSPEHLRNWLKRFRKKIAPLKIRFYGAGEYGEEKFRPHYHLAIFGWPSCPYVLYNQASNKECFCSSCGPIRETWKLGRIYVGTLESDSAQYIAGYVTKKMFYPDSENLVWDNRRHAPEFQRFSKNLGVSALWEVASKLMELGLDKSMPDVPSGLRHGKKILPLTPHMKRKLRLMIGKDEKTPQEILDEMAKEMSTVRQAAFENSLNVQDLLKDLSKQRLLNLESRQSRFKKKGVI